MVLNCCHGLARSPQGRRALFLLSSIHLCPPHETTGQQALRADPPFCGCPRRALFPRAAAGQLAALVARPWKPNHRPAARPWTADPAKRRAEHPSAGGPAAHHAPGRCVDTTGPFTKPARRHLPHSPVANFCSTSAAHPARRRKLATEPRARLAPHLPRFAPCLDAALDVSRRRRFSGLAQPHRVVVGNGLARITRQRHEAGSFGADRSLQPA